MRLFSGVVGVALEHQLLDRDRAFDGGDDGGNSSSRPSPVVLTMRPPSPPRSAAPPRDARAPPAPSPPRPRPSDASSRRRRRQGSRRGGGRRSWARFPFGNAPIACSSPRGGKLRCPSGRSNSVLRARGPNPVLDERGVIFSTKNFPRTSSESRGISFPTLYVTVTVLSIAGEGSRHSQNAFGSPACFKTSFAVCRLFERGTMTTCFPSASIHFL